MSGDVWLNGRHPSEHELAAVERARQHERDRVGELLAGVLTEEPLALYAGRTLDDLPRLA